MRIISGKAKGTQLKTLSGDATRPTADRVKEAVFSMIQFDIEDRSVLDLFSGSGQLALEALSRGAREATLVDKSKEAVSIIRENISRTKFSSQCTVYQSDYIDFIQKNDGIKFDIIFLDPPYAQKAYKSALKAMLEKNMLKPSTLIICESAEESILEGDVKLEENFIITKQSRYSKTFITILTVSKKEIQ